MDDRQLECGSTNPGLMSLRVMAFAGHGLSRYSKTIRSGWMELRVMSCHVTR